MAGKGNATVRLTGTKGQGIDKLKKSLQNRIIKKGVTKATQPVNKAVKAATPVRRGKDVQGGTLKKSIGYRITVNKRTGKVSGVIGARRGFKRQIGTAADGSAIFADPNRYLHLVEYGTRHSRARPFVRPTWRAMKSQAQAIVAAVIREEIKKQAVKKVKP